MLSGSGLVADSKRLDQWFSNFSGLRPTLDYDKLSRPTGLQCIF
ncbi:hypothetical protein T09_7954 [Trichinella sp. T9]|nr:hypothetical protein T09_7954 [Trichinella sp. T9]